MSGPWGDPRVRAGLARQFAARREALDAGALGIGWKVGFGAPASLDLMQISAPLMGYLTDETVLPSGTRVDTSGWSRGVVEFELYVVLGRDLGAVSSGEEAAGAVSAVGAAIELADVDLPVEASGVEDILASNIFHKGVVVGHADPARAGLDITGLVAHVLIDDEEYAVTGDLQAITGSYQGIVGTVADTLAANDELLREGDMIITGSVIPPVPVGTGTEFTFVLDPLEPISVRLP
jgi:2-oxo-3-hexenedioate decarboxylase